MTWQNRDNNVINIIMEKYMKVTGGQVDKHGEQQKYYHWENNKCECTEQVILRKDLRKTPNKRTKQYILV